MSPTGETPAAEPTTTVKLPDAVSLKMLETENAILRRRLDECRPYLKDGETPAQCIKRNRADVDVALGLLAKEKQKAESAAPSAEPTERIAVLESAIRWALGEEGEFGEEPEPVAGKYRQRFWWRSELRRRAGLSAAPAAGPDLREQIEQLEKWAAMEYAPCHYNADAADGWADGYRSAIGAVLALLDAAKER